MIDKNKKSKKDDVQDEHIQELTNDLQRTRADFENYRKRVDNEKIAAKQSGKLNAVVKLLPIIDVIERATSVIPKDIENNNWVKGIASLNKNIEKMTAELGLKKIDTKVGDDFDPETQQAVQFDEQEDGDREVVSDVLQAGYKLDDFPVRHTMVKVSRK
jgi:molecular chaperone GrpE